MWYKYLWPLPHEVALFSDINLIAILKNMSQFLNLHVIGVLFDINEKLSLLKWLSELIIIFGDFF